MALEIVKGNVINNQRITSPFTIGEWEMSTVYEVNDGLIVTDIVVDGKNRNGAFFRVVKSPLNTNFNFNGVEPDFELQIAVYNEIADIINTYVAPAK